MTDELCKLIWSIYRFAETPESDFHQDDISKQDQLVESAIDLLANAL
jgi:hypothetical protein